MTEPIASVPEDAVDELLGAQGPWTLEDLVRRTFLDDPALGHKHNTRRDPAHERHLVRHDVKRLGRLTLGVWLRKIVGTRSAEPS